jgi:hypothetical protein
MRRFKFSSSKTVIDIEGKTYEINMGDPKLQQDMLDFSMRLATIDYTEILGDLFETISRELNGFFVRLLGEEAAQEIFAGRDRSIIDQLNLYAYLNEEINQTSAVQQLEARLENLAPSLIKR